MPNWPVFWFETNSAWGLVNSQEVWAAMRTAWNAGGHRQPPEAIYNATLVAAELPQGKIPNFGTRAEHIGGQMTLGEFFDKNGVDRNIGATEK